MHVIKDDKSFLIKLGRMLSSLTTETKEPVEEEKVTPDEDLLNIMKAVGVDVEQRLCTEIVYKPIVKDLHGEWMSIATIATAEDSFKRNLEAGLVKANLFHVTNTEKFTINKSWILEEDTSFGEKVVEKGSWLVETHYADDALWEMKKSGKLGGLSLGAFGSPDATTGEITNLFFNRDEFKEAMSLTTKVD